MALSWAERRVVPLAEAKAVWKGKNWALLLVGPLAVALVKVSVHLTGLKSAKPMAAQLAALMVIPKDLDSAALTVDDLAVALVR